MRSLYKGLELWRVVYPPFEGKREIQKIKLKKELKTRWRCKFWGNDKYKGEIGISKYELTSDYDFQNTRQEAIKKALYRHINRLNALKEEIPKIKKEIEELKRLENEML